MVSPEEIPKPFNSGSDGTQIERTHSIDLVEANQLNELPLARTIRGIAASNTRAFGSEVASALIAGATSQLASELQYSKNELVQLRKQLDQLNEGFTQSKIQNAVLSERITSNQQSRHLRNLGIAIGTTLLTASISLFDSEKYQYYGFFSLIVGALLVIFGWYSPMRGGDK